MVQWRRIGAFCLGVGLILFGFWVDPYGHLPNTFATLLVGVPMGFLLFGVSERSLQESFSISICGAIGLVIGNYH